jgi:hypothetical protein
MLFEIWQDIRPKLGAIRSTVQWVRSGYSMPCPHYIKQASILRHAVPGSLFIETGTYKGATSRYFHKRGFKVATIEIHKPLFDQYSPLLRKQGIDARLGDSADVVPALLADYAASPSFTLFLDGHYSSGITGQGEHAVPIVREFDALIAFARAHRDKDIAVIVDDVRLFMPGGDPIYPARASLLAFAEAMGAPWKIENDLFLCRRTAAH